MTTSTKKTIAIIGATGNQGSSVAHTFLSLPNWHVRAITRDPTSQKASELADLGCEVVQADLTDIASLTRAFAGAHAIFLNTDFWATFRAATLAGESADKSSKLGFEAEVLHGKNAVQAAAGISTLEILVYSALGPMNRASGGKYPTSYHWETKAAIVDYIENEQPALAKKTSFIYLGAYVTNPHLMPKRDPVSGDYGMIISCSGSTKFPITNETKSTGVFVRALVEEEGPGTKLLAYDSYLTLDEAVGAWSRVTGKQAGLTTVTLEEMHKLTGVPYEVLWAPSYMEEFGYMAGISNYIEPHQLKGKVTTPSYEDYLRTRDVDQLLSVDFEI
ncbi:hypothetical protein F4808DRAFT_421559 [Astrocystis sublimbata]|nr:hypothetical protein F4808DRAFT_421559 [Astrocystis sublimbata]